MPNNPDPHDVEHQKTNNESESSNSSGETNDELPSGKAILKSKRSYKEYKKKVKEIFLKKLRGKSQKKSAKSFIKTKKHHTCFSENLNIRSENYSITEKNIAPNNHPFMSDWQFNNEVVSHTSLEPDLPSLESNVTSENNLEPSSNIFIGNPKLIRPLTFRECVAKAAIITITPRTQVNTWLYFLAPFGDLPKSYKTLLSTSREQDVKEINGNHWYKPSVTLEIILAIENLNLSSITIDIHVDGIPIGAKEVWPVTGFIREIKKPVLLVAFEGVKKPDRKELLEDLFIEINDMIEGGLPVGDSIITVKFGNLLCDAPARAFALNIVSHNATNACYKCWAQSFKKVCRNPRGRKSKSRPSFPVFCNKKRTDAQFRAKQQFSQISTETHHRSEEKLEIEILNVDIISCVPIDYMHTILLGIMKNQLLTVWCKEDLTFCEKLDEYLSKIKDCIPKEFPRKCRSYRDDWKATEFRLFLLYIGPVVLKHILDTNKYTHFLKLCLAIRIMCSDETVMMRNLNIAENLMFEFVAEYEILYPLQPISYNLHMANHLVEICREQKINLDKFSCFPGENFLQKLKNFYERGPSPLKQIIKRFSEEKVYDEIQSLKEFECRLQQQIGDTNFFKKCEIKNFTIGVDKKNSFIKAKDFIISVQSIENRGNVVVFKGLPCCIVKDVFDQPMSSRGFGMFYVNMLSNANAMEFTNKEISHKFLSIPQPNGVTALVELLHGNESAS